MSQMSQSFISILSMLQDIESMTTPLVFGPDSVECPTAFQNHTASMNTQRKNQNQFTVLTGPQTGKSNVNAPNNVTIAPLSTDHSDLEEISLVSKDTMSNHWQNELKNHWYTIEEQTIITLELIKQDRIRKGLPFDEKFKGDFLRAANTILCDTFEQFMMEKQLDSTSVNYNDVNQPSENCPTDHAQVENGNFYGSGPEVTFAHHEDQSAAAKYSTNTNQNHSSIIHQSNLHSEHFVPLNSQQVNCQQSLPIIGNDLNVIDGSMANIEHRTKENITVNNSFGSQLTNTNVSNPHNQQIQPAALLVSCTQYPETIDLISDDEFEEKPKIDVCNCPDF